MASSHHLLINCLTFSLLLTLFTRICVADVNMYPFACSLDIKKCDALLYHPSSGLEKEQIASNYSVDSDNFRPIYHGENQDYLIPVTCTCEDLGNGTKGYFYDASYTVKKDDTFSNISATIYNGQALEVEGEEEGFKKGVKVFMHLVCGCLESQSKTVVTYTVQRGDVLSEIASMFSATINDIQRLNGDLTKDPDVIFAGSVLYVPMPKDRIPAAPKKSE